ncbi:MAG TPA: TatD family hydrolase [Flavobacteriales bacterium]|jgi:TatD DNase family protein
MYLIDTHSHIYQPPFDEDLDAMVQRALEANVKKILLPNIDLESVERMHALCDAYPEVCYPMMGLHPCDVKENNQEVLDALYKHFSTRKYIAVGEIGIDLYWDKTTLPYQVEAFKIQINWAKELGLPIVIHARESFDEIFAVLDEMNDERLKGVFHCFTGTLEQAQKVMSYGGFIMGIGGVLTYEKSGLDKVVADIPMDYLVLETDSPYLTPKPYRGKRNESAYTRIVAEKLALVKGISLEEVMVITTRNAEQLFKV